jgi:hypothetical protein
VTDWPRSGTHAAHRCFGQTTMRAWQGPSNFHSLHHCSANSALMPEDFSGLSPSSLKASDEKNLDWFFPSIPDRRNIFDKFCVLSLTYRSNGFVTMLAPLRDYLRPENPTLSPLLHSTRESYFKRLSIDVDPDRPNYEETRWITSEDVNVEHLLNIFTSTHTHSDDIWDACAHFMEHIFWHKPQLVVLGPKLEGLPDDHPSKPTCLYQLSRLFDSVGNFAECKRLFVHTLKLWRERGDDFGVAGTLLSLSLHKSAAVPL